MRRLLVVAAAALLVLGVIAAPSVHAQGSQTLDVNGPPNTPDGEKENVTQGGTATLSALVMDGVTPVKGANVDFEIEKGPNDGGANDNGASGFVFPVDLTCNTADDGTCSVQYPDVATTHTANGGVDQIRAWIDSDNNDSTLETDLTEGANEVSSAGTIPEPDGTDVVLVAWTPPSAANLNVEPEQRAQQKNTNQSFTVGVASNNGQPVSGARVDYRIETGPNQAPPAHACDTGSDGTCAFQYKSPDTGTNRIRFWIDDGNDLPDEADNSEGQDERTNPGNDPEPDNTDVVLIQWVDKLISLDVTPETNSARNGDNVGLNAFVTDVNNAALANQTVVFQVKTGPDKLERASCTTDSSGNCSASINGAGGTGDDVVMGWVDANGNGFSDEADSNEGQDEGAKPGSDLEPDKTDVVGISFSGFCPGHHDDSRNQIVGTDDGEVLVGTPAADVICGKGGDDTLKGKGGNDVLIGGDGGDLVNGGSGDDVVNGNAGDDQLNGNAGDDKLNGGTGDDTMNGGFGRDRCRQGGGAGPRIHCET